MRLIPYPRHTRDITKPLAADAAWLEAIRSGSGLHANLRSSDVARLVEALCLATRTKDLYTYEHSRRVAAYLVFLADKVRPDLTDERALGLTYAGLLHDIGKLCLPTPLLAKPGRLSVEEMRCIQQHPRTGAQVIALIPALAETLPVILYHHERFDGRGYPFGLRGTSIPLYARMAALADSFDAMTSDRAYRSPLSLDAALNEIISHSGTQFDPQLVGVLVREYAGLRHLHRTVHRQPALNPLPVQPLVRV